MLDSYPTEFGKRILFLRQLIHEVADEIEDIGEIEETLKWGEPSYLVRRPGIGSTVRIAWKRSKKKQYSMLFKCTANLVPAFRERFPRTFVFGGNRSIDFGLHDDVPADELKQCIAMALTYHRNKKLEPAERWDAVSGMSSSGRSPEP